MTRSIYSFVVTLIALCALKVSGTADDQIIAPNEKNKAAFIKALPDAFFPSGRKPLGRIPEPYVAVGLFSLADSDEDGMATKQSLTSSFDGLFEKLAPGNSGKLNEHSLMIGLRSLIHQSRNGGEKR